MRLCWADKVPLALFALITVTQLIFAGWAPDDSQYCQLLRIEHPTWTSADSYCFVTVVQQWTAFAYIEGILFLKIILPVWVCTRAFDLLGNGPALRRSARDRSDDSIARTMADFDLPRAEWTSSMSDFLQRRHWRE